MIVPISSKICAHSECPSVVTVGTESGRDNQWISAIAQLQTTSALAIRRYVACRHFLGFQFEFVDRRLYRRTTRPLTYCRFDRLALPKKKKMGRKYYCKTWRGHPFNDWIWFILPDKRSRWLAVKVVHSSGSDSEPRCIRSCVTYIPRKRSTNPTPAPATLYPSNGL